MKSVPHRAQPQPGKGVVHMAGWHLPATASPCPGGAQQEQISALPGAWPLHRGLLKRLGDGIVVSNMLWIGMAFGEGKGRC